MLTKRKHLSKKEIKEDKFITAYYKAVQYADTYKIQILIGVAVVIAAAIAAYYYIDNKQEANQTASVEFAKVMPLYDSGVLVEAIEGQPSTGVKGLKYIVEEYGSTQQGEIAKIYLANCYYYVNSFDEAMKYYEDYSGGDGIFQASAYAGMAACYEAKENWKEAAKYYERAFNEEETNSFNADYLLRAGINYKQTGEAEKAKELLKKLKNDYPQTIASREADRYLVQLN